MKTKREINIVLLTFAITTMIWCFTWAYVVSTVTKDCQQQIEQLTK